MGYKLAGYEVIGNCEIDPRMMAVYRVNHHPKLPYLMDIRELVEMDLPDELYQLDILDGSPPCSVFSTAGARDAGWGVEKVFREGQAAQRLDDLFFWFIRLAEKLKPKVVIAENVTGLLKGNARGYVREILAAYDKAGYAVQLFQLNAARMGVPQKRERVFFIAHRKDVDVPKLALDFCEPEIPFGTVREDRGKPVTGETTRWLLDHRRPGDKDLRDINKRIRGAENTGFTNKILDDGEAAYTIASGGSYYRMSDGMGLTDRDFVNVQTFPQDYNFLDQDVQYICGMSVPPVMMAQIASQVHEQWLAGIPPTSSG